MSEVFSRLYTLHDQRIFAALSGDTNPLHLDPVAASRTLMGEPVAYGLNMVLSALDQVTDCFGIGEEVKSLVVTFPKPLRVGSPVDYFISERDNGMCRVVGLSRNERVLDLTVKTAERSGVYSDPVMPPLTPISICAPSFDEVASKSGIIPIGFDPLLAKDLFPNFLKVSGPMAMAETLALTRLVGMVCPGLHSLFYSMDIRYVIRDDGHGLRYKVTKTDRRFSLIDIAVEGTRVSGIVRAFYRPPPVAQPCLATIASHVAPGDYRNVVALIVGGTRGLGETTAKIIASGGGTPVITYYRGTHDAERVAEEIRKVGGRCLVRYLDVTSDRAFDQFFVENSKINSIYYFATPKIFGRKSGFFDYELLGEFNIYYVISFGRLIDSALKSCQPLRVFYPSSIAVDEKSRETAEYQIAKRNGEDLCEYYNNNNPDNISIIIKRLPRIMTDQTSTLSPVPADGALDIMLPLVECMEKHDLPGRDRSG